MFLVLSLLVACGGSTAPSRIEIPTFGGTGSGALSTSELLSLQQPLAELSSANGQLNEVLPTTPMATYDGVILAQLDTDVVVAGNFNMVADFVNSNLSGTASDFASFDTKLNGRGRLETLSGTLPITGGSVNGGGAISGAKMAASLAGNLSGALGTYQVSVGVTNGTFLDNGGTSIVYGGIVGQVINPDTTTSLVNNGDFLGTN